MSRFAQAASIEGRCLWRADRGRHSGITDDDSAGIANALSSAQMWHSYRYPNRYEKAGVKRSRHSQSRNRALAWPLDDLQTENQVRRPKPG